jgi:hypothetical protein
MEVLLKDIPKIFQHGGHKTFLFPPQAAKHISVLDNPLFAVLKQRIKKLDTNTQQAKQDAFEQVCLEFDPESVKRFWTHCGGSFRH